MIGPKYLRVSWRPTWGEAHKSIHLMRAGAHAFQVLILRVLQLGVRESFLLVAISTLYYGMKQTSYEDLKEFLVLWGQVLLYHSMFFAGTIFAVGRPNKGVVISRGYSKGVHIVSDVGMDRDRTGHHHFDGRLNQRDREDPCGVMFSIRSRNFPLTYLP